MRKLIIALVAVATAVAVNAAVVDWNYEITGQAGGSSSEYTGYTAYLVDASYYESLSVVTADSITGSGNYIQSATLSQTGSSGKGSNKKYVFSTGAQGYTSTSYTTGTEYQFYLVLVDSSEENYFASSYSYTARDATSGYTESDITLAVNSSAVSMQAFGAAPEPTSGLLLLLGVAGLALKRKVA